MSNPPRIWLTYRPVRIGWVVEGGNIPQLVTATSWSTCLWGGRFNPIIPIDDAELANNLIATFGVDVLIPVAGSEATSAFVARPNPKRGNGLWVLNRLAGAEGKFFLPPRLSGV